MMVWENVFGTWVGWSPRDKSILRTMLPIQRRYVKLFSGEGWTPLVPTEAPDLFASLWEGSGGKLRVWTLVNRSPRTIQTTMLRVASADGARYYDLIRGCEAQTSGSGPAIGIAGVIRPRGIAAFAAGTDAVLGKDFRQFLASRRKLTLTPTSVWISRRTSPPYASRRKRPNLYRHRSCQPWRKFHPL